MKNSIIIPVLLYILTSIRLVADTTDSCRGNIVFDTTFSVTINKSFQPYYFSIKHRKDISAEWPEYCYEIICRSKPDKQIIQTISGTSSSNFDAMPSELYPLGIEFIDLNFDNCLDFKFFNGSAANGINSGYDVYLFNPKRKIFVYNEMYSEVAAGNYFEIDSTKKEITTSGESGCMGRCWSTETYKVIGDSLILIHRISQTKNDTYPEEYYRTEEKLVNGKLIVVKKEKVNLDN